MSKNIYGNYNFKKILTVTSHFVTILLESTLILFCFWRETKLAKKYYDKLFKEYCIADLSKYKENKVDCLSFLVFILIVFNCVDLKVSYCVINFKVSIQWLNDAAARYQWVVSVIYGSCFCVDVYTVKFEKRLLI